MTSSGTCHQCGKVADQFFYRTPRKDAFAPHDGYWHCAEHGPNLKLDGEKIVEVPTGSKAITDGMNRAERRLYARKGIVRA